MKITWKNPGEVLSLVSGRVTRWTTYLPFVPEVPKTTARFSGSQEGLPGLGMKLASWLLFIAVDRYRAHRKGTWGQSPGDRGASFPGPSSVVTQDML